MFKNIVIAVLAACCIFLVLNQRMERVAWGEGEISPAEYGGLAALRDIFPPDEYRDRVLPLLRGAFQDGKISRDRLRGSGNRIEGAGCKDTFRTGKGAGAGQIRQSVERRPFRS